MRKFKKDSEAAPDIEDLLTQAYSVRVNNLDKSITLTQDVIKKSEYSHPNLHAKALNLLALFFMIKGDFDESLELSEKALNFFDKNKDLKGIADAKYNIASVNYKTDKYHKGLQHLLDCLQLYRQLKDPHNEARVLKSMGTIYEYFGDQNNAIESYLKCIEVAEKVGDENQISNAYNPLSGIYLKQGKEEMALAIIQRSISIKEETKDIRGYAFALYGRGKVFFAQKKLIEAKEDFIQALSIQQKMGDKLGEGMAMIKLGMVYITLQNFEEAESHLQNAITLAKKHSIQMIQFKAHHTLYQLYSQSNRLKEALTNLESYIKIKEAVINTHTYDVIKSYESIKKIESLEHNAKLQKEKAEIIERKNAELDSFFYRISHDLKGPISSLFGLNNLVKNDITDPISVEYFNMYQKQILRINNIVMDLIDLTRMNHQKEKNSSIDFHKLVKEVVSSYSYTDNFGKINFIVNVKDDINYISEWGVVSTILQNLVENAIKYSRQDAEPYVGIYIARENDELIIKVEDNGLGIRVQDQDKIFNMFFRANDTVQGTGLGLYILKRAVERLHGEITLKSQVNVGSTFITRFPINNS